MSEYRIGQRVTDGNRRGTVVGRDDESDRVQVVWDDGQGESLPAAAVRHVGSAA